MMRYKKKEFYILFFILVVALISPLNRVIFSPKNIIGHLNKINSSTLENRKEHHYNYMGYSFINEITSKISDKSISPLLIYRNHSYGVRAVLDGFRFPINRNILIAIDLDKKIPDNLKNIINCKNYYKRNKLVASIKECEVTQDINITGIIFDRKLNDNERVFVDIFTKTNKVIKLVLNKKDIVTSPKISSYKFYNKKSGLFNTLQTTDLKDGRLKIIIKSDKKLIFFLTGYNKNSEIGNKVDQHFILKWDDKDARNYIGINKNVIGNDLKIKDKKTCQILNDIFRENYKGIFWKQNYDCN